VDDGVRQGEDGIQKRQQNVFALVGAKDFFEGQVGAGVEELHGLSLTGDTSNICQFL
jgi:hypothetical protein